MRGSFETCLCGDPACPLCFSQPSGTLTDAQEQTVTDAVEGILDMVLVGHYDAHADETYTECLVCGGFEDHGKDCFVPSLARWMSAKPVQS